MDQFHYICKICKLHPGIRSREIYTCNECFSKSFIKKFRYSIKLYYEKNNLIIFDGTIGSSVLFFMLKNNINSFYNDKFTFISNITLPYKDINNEIYINSDIKINKPNWLKKYNCTNLIKHDSINMRVENIFKSICHFDLITYTEDFTPFANFLDDEIKRFYEIHRLNIYNPVNIVLPFVNGFDEVNKKFCQELTNWNPSSHFNITNVFKKVEKNQNKSINNL